MTRLPGSDSRLDDFAAWRDHASEEVWEISAFDADPAPALANSFQITDLQHWLDLCA